jgi:hypothetical protein
MTTVHWFIFHQPSLKKPSFLITLKGCPAEIRTLLTEIVFTLHRIRIPTKYDHRITFGARRWLIVWRVLQLLKIVFIRTIIHIHLGLVEIVLTDRTVFPAARMIFDIVVATQRITSMISAAAIPSIREQNILILVITDPLITAFCPRQVARFSAQATSRDVCWILPFLFL